jgi:hypothetical protein
MDCTEDVRDMKAGTKCIPRYLDSFKLTLTDLIKRHRDIPIATAISSYTAGILSRFPSISLPGENEERESDDCTDNSGQDVDPDIPGNNGVVVIRIRVPVEESHGEHALSLSIRRYISDMGDIGESNLKG